MNIRLEKPLAAAELSIVYTMARFVNKSSTLFLMNCKISIMLLLNARERGKWGRKDCFCTDGILIIRNGP